MNIKRLTTLIALFTIIILASSAQKLPKQESILNAMELANKHFIEKHPDAGAATFVKKMRPSNLWTRGVYFEGLYELTVIEKKVNSPLYDTNFKYIIDWGNAHEWFPRNGIKTRNADDYCCGQTYLRIYSQIKDYVCLEPTMQCMDNTLRNRESLSDWTWIDAIQMGLPVLTKLSQIKATEGDETFSRYADWGWKMYAWTRNEEGGGLFNKEEGLWWRDKDFVPPYKEPNGKNCYWSRGNGWVYAALVRAMQDIMDTPNYDSHLDDYKADFLAMTEALKKCQRKDGFWNVSLHDESNFGGKELTGTSLFLYGMAWGVNNGILPKKEYQPIIIKTWNALVKECLHKDGTLGFVQGTGKQPSDSQPVTFDSEPDFDDFGLGCFLLAGSEIYKLKK